MSSHCTHTQRFFWHKARSYARIPKLKSSEFFGRTGQLIVAEAKELQLCQLPELGRDGACQCIFGHKTISGRLVYQPINLSKKVLTSQFVPIQLQVHQGGAEAEFRRNVACAARRSFLVRGTLVYQTGEMSTKLTYRSAGYSRDRDYS